MEAQQNSQSAMDQAIKILDYWHKIEFFESTDIKDLEEGANGVLTLSTEQLLESSILPWRNPQQIRQAGKGYFPDKSYRYTLYFGIFARKEIFTRVSRIWPESANIAEDQLQDEGRTCSIKCSVDQDGVIVSNSFEFSTVTWALGQLETGKLSQLSMKAYDTATQKLQQRFLEIIATADNLKDEFKLSQHYLTTHEILEFLKVMGEWTHFSPEIEAPALYIKLNEVKPNGTKSESGSSLQENMPDPDMLREFNQQMSSILAHSFPAIISNLTSDASDDIPILNSFYLRDIERVIQSIKERGITADSPLGCYLIGNRKKKADLLTLEGRSLLLEKLKLSHLPYGRWPSDSAHNMSLMQQFAINTLNDELTQTGLYSINGPPGTGKTTLLRDLIADNLVKRAIVLASFDNASDALADTITLTYNSEQKKVRCLVPQLAGFEIVVVSSNNAAVENISRELPQQKSLGRAWRDSNYLKTAAQKLAAEHKQQDGKPTEVKPLTEENECWGLISVALGKRRNRDVFANNLFFASPGKCTASAPADQYCTLFHVFKQPPDNGFIAAKTAFIQAQDKVDTILVELERLEALPAQQDACKQQEEQVEKYHLRQLHLNARLAKQQARQPAWWSLKLADWCRKRAIIAGLERRRAAAYASYQLAKHQFEQLKTALLIEQQQCEVLQQKYPDAIFATQKTSLEAADIQRTSFGHCQALNEARTCLTLEALKLHQAWLEQLYKGELHDSIFLLSQAVNGRIQDKQANMALWRLLFMIVPVVSSTFASVASQFRAFSEGDIGWLFIDEAGQATPQQAVGAIWRARRVVAVGDPLQIEPVFTIPPGFVEAIARNKLGDKVWHEWSPTVQSVQTVADRVNPYGTGQIAKDIWLGSPLRIHRRCDEPMFTIANKIAYNNKMLHGRDNIWPDDEFLWGRSCWFDIRGEVDGKHFVPEQARHVLAMLHLWLEHHQALPDVYIISPFKRVKNKLKAFLGKELKGIPKSSVWLKERIGTVHTFQGKEEKSVILVLGLSDNSHGAEKWASSKPNLLNVAVTRAQKRIYIIGNRKIWSECPYFSVAWRQLLEN